MIFQLFLMEGIGDGSNGINFGFSTAGRMSIQAETGRDRQSRDRSTWEEGKANRQTKVCQNEL